MTNKKVSTQNTQTFQQTYAHREIELQCGDLGDIIADYYVDYDVEAEGYYAGKYFINSQKVFLTLYKEINPIEIEVTSLVSPDVLDQIFNIYIVEENQ